MQSLVSDRRFRADLFYRLQVLTIRMPSLRERLDELPALVSQVLPRGATLTRAAERELAAYEWPGNIRELKNTLWRASILAEGHPIEPAMLYLPSAAQMPATPHTSDLTLAVAEARAIDAALTQTGGNRARAALLLGIARSTLHEKLRHRTSPDSA